MPTRSLRYRIAALRCVTLDPLRFRSWHYLFWLFCSAELRRTSLAHSPFELSANNAFAVRNSRVVVAVAAVQFVIRCNVHVVVPAAVDFYNNFCHVQSGAGTVGLRARAAGMVTCQQQRCILTAQWHFLHFRKLLRFVRCHRGCVIWPKAKWVPTALCNANRGKKDMATTCNSRIVYSYIGNVISCTFLKTRKRRCASAVWTFYDCTFRLS